MTSTSTWSPEVIEISVPALPRYGPTLQTVASAMGADAGWSVDEIDDLKLALTEVLSMMIDHDEITRVCAGFRSAGGK